MDLGTLITLLKLATESGALAKPDPKPVGIADLPKTPPYEFTPPPGEPTFGLECPIGQERFWDGFEFKCKSKGFN